jgi:hypothetical protein
MNRFVSLILFLILVLGGGLVLGGLTVPGGGGREPMPFFSLREFT